ncbi:Gfo/Idh/MocA family protein [Actinomyces qiguomingii]|uniref:Gfo/Idh/MocA family protein n=1 Tax=Actinomyces qiguomingii TaxID=2057800 RepID=UPI000CA05F09|nr:Gfo/Idh/MocA family oxidoreductase [Actinomyces qiguomingii]
MSRTLTIAMNGITGRMGYRQHLIRSVLPLRDGGGLLLEDGSRLQVEPILVGRNASRLKEIAARHGIERWTTDQDAIICDPGVDVYFDAQTTSRRYAALAAAFDAGKHIYTEKPTAATLQQAVDLASRAAATNLTVGVVHDKLYLPGLIKLRRLVDEGFFGRILSLRGEFGYWVFEGDVRPGQRPSWNYRKQDGGGMMVDMFCHWSYVLESILGSVKSVYSQAVTHIPTRWDEQGQAYPATADDAAYAVFEVETPTGETVIAQLNSSWAVRVHRRELVEFQVDGTHGSAVAGLFHCESQQRANTPRASWDPDVPADLDFMSQWIEVPDDGAPANGFRAQWEEFLRDVATGRPHRYGPDSAARGVQLAALGQESTNTGRKLSVPPLTF